MMDWFQIFSGAASLVSLAAAILLAIAFWRLGLFAPTAASRIGGISSLVNLAIWFIYGMLMVSWMLPFDGLSTVTSKLSSVPYLWQALWALGTLSLSLSLACLAWTIRRGIPKPELPPG